MTTEWKKIGEKRWKCIGESHWEGSSLIVDRPSIVVDGIHISKTDAEVDADFQRWIKDFNQDLNVLRPGQNSTHWKANFLASSEWYFYLYPDKVPTPETAQLLVLDRWIGELNRWIYGQYEPPIGHEVLRDREKDSFMNAGVHKLLPNSAETAIQQIRASSEPPDMPIEAVARLWIHATANFHDLLRTHERIRAVRDLLPLLPSDEELENDSAAIYGKKYNSYTQGNL